MVVIKIKHRHYYKYFSVNTNNDRSTVKDAIRIIQWNTAIRQLNGTLWCNNVSRKTKPIIYKTIVESIAIYRAQLCVIKDEDRSKMQATKLNSSCQLVTTDVKGNQR